MNNALRAALGLALLLPVFVAAHEGDSEERAMHMLALTQQLDRSWAASQRETDPAKRTELLNTHARALAAAQQALGEAADKSPCVLLEARDTGRQLACLTDTEARLRATEKLMGHVVNRLTLSAGP